MLSSRPGALRGPVPACWDKVLGGIDKFLGESLGRFAKYLGHEIEISRTNHACTYCNDIGILGGVALTPQMVTSACLGES